MSGEPVRLTATQTTMFNMLIASDAPVLMLVGFLTGALRHSERESERKMAELFEEIVKLKSERDSE